jgi:hypothetical protein
MRHSLRAPSRVLTPWAILLALTGSLSACVYLPFGYTALGDVLSNPARFEGWTVKVRGRIAQVNKVPLLDIQSYTLAEAGHGIPVMTGNNLPTRGSWVAVVGVVHSFAIVGGRSIGVHLREKQRVDLKYLRIFR